ncbi:nitroreductase family protein, partial [Chryseosolibacter indicus]
YTTQLQATHHGLNVHQMGGFNVDKLKENLNVPETHEPIIVLAIGYPGEVTVLPEHLQLRENAPRERYLQQEFVMNKTF